MTSTAGRGDFVRWGLAVLRVAVPAAVGLVLVTTVLAAASSLAAGASPLVGAKRALFVVGWLAVGLVALTAWRRADGTAQSDSQIHGTDMDRRRRTDGGRTRRFDRSAIRWRLLVAGLTALVVSILLEVGLGVGG